MFKQHPDAPQSDDPKSSVCSLLRFSPFWEKMAVLMRINPPERLTRAPPELPGLMETSV
jgi:hypothetical protein